jgi:hypothetical protein
MPAQLRRHVEFLLPGADQASLQVIQNVLDITLFSRGEDRWVHIGQA